MDNVFLDGLLDGRGDKAKEDGLFPSSLEL
jgi:hypothetical protein